MAIRRKFTFNEVLVLQVDPVCMKKPDKERVGAKSLLGNQQIHVLSWSGCDVGHSLRCKWGEEHQEQPAEKWIHVE